MKRINEYAALKPPPNLPIGEVMVTEYTVSNRVSGEFEPSLWIRNLEIAILRAETCAQNAGPVARLPEIRAAETRFDLAKSRNNRDNFFGPDMANRDRTGWLSMQSAANRSPVLIPC
jgi:hypothetical protein